MLRGNSIAAGLLSAITPPRILPARKSPCRRRSPGRRLVGDARPQAPASLERVDRETARAPKLRRRGRSAKAVRGQNYRALAERDVQRGGGHGVGIISVAKGRQVGGNAILSSRRAGRG